MSRRSIEDAANLLRSVPAKASAPDALPVLQGELSLVYAYVGAPNRVLELAERGVAIGAAGTIQLYYVWDSVNAPVRKTERFKAWVRNAGLVDFWRARGWSDLCRPMGGDDFVCD